MVRLIFSFTALLFIWTATSIAQVPLEGVWNGTAIRGGQRRPIVVQFVRGADSLKAQYWIPALTLEQIPLGTVSFATASGSIVVGHSFQATLSGDRMKGTLRPILLHGAPIEVELTRGGSLPDPGTTEGDVSFVSRGNRLRGTLVTPRDLGRRHAGIVSLHGSGPSTRWLALSRARRFARAGYAMLIFDKPGSGESQGDWTMTSLDEMAQDAVAALDYLRSRPEVDPGRVGFWGHSQAGWVISRAGSMSDKIAFAIVLAGGGAAPRVVEDYGYLGRLKHAGASPASADKAMAWVRNYYDYIRTGQGYDALVGLLKADADTEWVKALDTPNVYPTPEQQPKWQWVATYDPASDIQRIKFPVLLLFAEKDESSPSEQSLSLWRAGLRKAGNRRVNWKIFASAEHHFLVPAQTDGWPSIAPGYYETQIDWLNRNSR